jgi:hypothetical protein
MSPVRSRLLLVFCTVMFVAAAKPVSGQGMADTYRQAASTYRAMAADASGAAKQCDIQLANYYDSVANSMFGGQALPEPTCTPGSGGGSDGGSGTSSNSFGASSSSGFGSVSGVGSGGSTSMQQSQELLTEGVGLFQQLYEERQARKEQERKLKEEQQQRANELRQQQADEQKQREIEAEEQRLVEEAKKEQQMNDDACQLLVQSRAMLGQTVDLAGDNACSRITDAILKSMATYHSVGGRRTPQRSPNPEPVIDGSNIPSTIDFTPTPKDESDDDALDSLMNSLPDLPYDEAADGKSSLQQLQDEILPEDNAESSKSASDQLLDSIGTSTDSAKPTISGGKSSASEPGKASGPPPGVIDQLNQLLDAASKPTTKP